PYGYPTNFYWFIGISLIIYFKKVIYYHIIRERVVKKNSLKFH
ncbi:hypothetical protein M785_09880, partial [Neisseria gonorrhoeae MU_NG20]